MDSVCGPQLTPAALVPAAWGLWGAHLCDCSAYLPSRALRGPGGGGDREVGDRAAGQKGKKGGLASTGPALNKSNKIGI